MNRDPKTWARLGRAIRDARQRRKLTQQQLADLAGVSSRSVQDAEAGTVPKARMPISLGPIAAALGWPEGTIDTILSGGMPPGEEWRDVTVQQQIDEDVLSGIITTAMVRATENTSSAEIRAAIKIALDELRRHGYI
jgi:transcriptional regulator with XRE-family HTH domain